MQSISFNQNRKIRLSLTNIMLSYAMDVQ